MKKINPADATFRNIDALKRRVASVEAVSYELIKMMNEVIFRVNEINFNSNPNPGKQEKNMAKKKGTKKGGKKGSC